MISQFGRAMQYWFAAIFRPGRTMDKFRSDPDKLNVSLLLITTFSILYAGTAALLYATQMRPTAEPWLPVAKTDYYLFQALWTVPWGLVTALALAAITHALSVMGGRPSEGQFEDALAITSIAWAVPSFVLMWLPETFAAVVSRSVSWPGWVDVVRLAVVAPIWYVVLDFIGIRKTYGVKAVRAFAVALAFVAVSYGMFLVFIR